MASTYRGIELRYRLTRRLALTLLVLPLSAPTQAEITIDGSLGSFRGSLAGPAFQIDANLGKQVGSNLFHSFGAFNIHHPESATFTANGSSGPIANVLSRVTGDSASTIDGLLRSTIPNASLFFFNPHGVVFGPHAQLDVPSSFHVSTADYLRLEDGVRFDAQPSANDALLTTAPPAAFGFLSEQPAGISVQGSAMGLKEGKTFSLVGGDFDFVGAGFNSQGQPTSFLRAPGGHINLASVASAGEVTLGETGLGTESLARFGKIDMAHGATLNVSGQGGGSVFIRGGQLVMDDSLILSNPLGRAGGGNVAVKADRLHLKGGARMSTSTFGPGKGGNLHVEGKDILLEEISGLSSNTTGAGPAGQLTVKAGRLQIKGGARIGSGTFGPGKGGNLHVEAEDIVMEGSFRHEFPSGLSVSSEPGASGDAGSITVKADSLQIKEGAQIKSVTSGTGKGGNVRVEAADILLSGDGAKSLSQ